MSSLFSSSSDSLDPSTIVGLSLTPNEISHELDSHETNESHTPSQVNEADFECALCCSVMYDPITTEECGHTFCRICLHRSLEIKKQCPLCRTPCHIDALSHAPTAILSNLIQRLFPQTWQQRKVETNLEIVRRVKAPRFGIFVSHQPLFPGAPIQLHIFEPKYRVMISRALAGTRQFIIMCANEQQQQPLMPPEEGVIDQQANVDDPPQHPLADQQPDNGAPLGEDPLLVAARVPGLAGAVPLPPLPFDAPRPARRPRVLSGDVGMMVRIVRCQAHADGRSFVEAIGVARGRVTQVREEDEAAFGLISAEFETIQDETDENPTQTSTTLEPDAAALPDQTPGSIDRNEDGSSLRRRGHVSTPGFDDGATAASSSSSSSVAAATSNSANPADQPESYEPSSESSSSSSTPVAPSDSDLIAHCRVLLDTYCLQSGLTLDRLGRLHGGPCPNVSTGHDANAADGGGGGDAANPALTGQQTDQFIWWVMRVVPGAIDAKQSALASTNRRQRLHLCVTVLQDAIDTQKCRTQNQVRFVAVLCMLAVGMVILRQYQLIG